jgi:hypothetical protein
MEPVLEGFGDQINFEMHFIGNVYSSAEWNALTSEHRSYYQQYAMCVEEENGNNYCSLHGEDEIIGDIAQLCAIEHYPDQTLDFALSYIENSYDWEAAATELGMDSTIMSACVNGEEGLDLYEEDVSIAEELMIGSSPSFLYDNSIMSRLSVETVLCTLHDDLAGCEDIASIQSNMNAQPTGSC